MSKKEKGSYDVEVRVKSANENCGFGHKVGDIIRFDRGIQGEICYTALLIILPKVYAMRYGAKFPWTMFDGGDGDTVEVACADHKYPVVFEIKRIRK